MITSALLYRIHTDGWSRLTRYTAPEKIAITGASNGGTLGAAAPAMGVMDLLRFHKFTIGWSWKSEYGDPDDPEDVEFLLGYSPYHNITQGVEYPSVMIPTVLFVCQYR